MKIRDKRLDPLEKEAERKRIKQPSVEQMMRWEEEKGMCKATDGCWVEPDGTCPHGCKSWLLELGYI